MCSNREGVEVADSSTTIIITRGQRTEAASTAQAQPFRRDIQGLRAFAVLVVFLDHLLGWPTGGFAGVDIFFVISGFVITAGLLRQYERTGRISAREFYVKRVKRIIPAATLVLVATTTLGFAIFAQQRAVATFWDAIAAFLFYANWNFAIDGTDYFQQGSAVSPIQHYWSLSVEEQFYFVWPWLLLGLLALFARYGRMTAQRSRVIAGSSVTILIACSFAWASVQSSTSPTFAYFSTFTRAWELGLGALLAVCAPLLTRLPPIARVVIAYAGLAGMTLSCLVITSTTSWPAPWALLPTLATVMVIASGVGREARFLWPLTNRLSVYIGDISYSIYLWHFPVIIFGRALFPQAGITTYLGIAVAGFGLAIAAYHAVERPLWKSPLWEERPRGTWRAWRAQNADPARDGGLIGLAITTATVVALALSVTSPVQGAPVARYTYQADTDEDPATELDQAAGDVAVALRATQWGELIPSIDEIGPESKAKAWVEDGCLALERGADSDPAMTANRCVFGTGQKTAVLVGDSYAISWFPAVQEALGDEWTIHILTMALCPVSAVSVVKDDLSPFPACDGYQTWARDRITELKPDLSIAGQADSTLLRLAPEQSPGTAAEAVREGLIEALSEISASSERTVVLSAPPNTMNIADCYTSTSSPSDCVANIDPVHLYANRAAEGAVSVIDRPDVNFANLDRAFCAVETCPAAINGYIVRADTGHLTEAFSRSIAPVVREALQN